MYNENADRPFTGAVSMQHCNLAIALTDLKTNSNKMSFWLPVYYYLQEWKMPLAGEQLGEAGWGNLTF